MGRKLSLVKNASVVQKIYVISINVVVVSRTKELCVPAAAQLCMT